MQWPDDRPGCGRWNAMETLRIAWVGRHPLDAGMRAVCPGVAVVPLDPLQVLSFDDVVRLAGFAPEVIVYSDKSGPPPFSGLERYPCLTVFYCVDSHIHAWYPDYAQAFDLCAVSLRDHLPRFVSRLGAERVMWLPPFPRQEDRPKDAPKIHDLLFVGKVDPVLTPGRHAFLAELGRLVPGLCVTRGAYRDLFPTAKLVLNVAEGGDLNFRVFEALACGACLLTPEVGHGQSELFTPGEHLFTYPPMDVRAVAELTAGLLADAPRRERVAAAGEALVRSRHRPEHRAAALVDFIQGHRPFAGLIAARQATAASLFSRVLRPLYLHWAEALHPSPEAAVYLAMGRRSRAAC
ncbi:glycosyltransferase family protein [Desulfolutivibrio sulfodismutans]|nr:glycosyltransferase [Desulfolutivibrio sulfodismutans]